MNKNSGLLERRSAPRVASSENYFFLPGGNAPEPFYLKNISVTGACIVTETLLPVNAVVDLHICRERDLLLKSQVVWSKGDEYGVSFMLDTEESFKAISFIMNTK